MSSATSFKSNKCHTKISIIQDDIVTFCVEVVNNYQISIGYVEAPVPLSNP